MENRDFTYRVGDKTFYQKELTLGQLEALGELMADLPSQTVRQARNLEESGVQALVLELFKRKLISRAISIVLVEQGARLDTRNFEETLAFIQNNLTIDIALGVIKDFFTCNDASKLASGIADFSTTLQGMAPTMAATPEQPPSDGGI